MRETGHGEAVRAAVGALNAGDAAGYLRASTPTSLRWVPGVGTHTGAYLGVASTGREISVEQCEVYEFDAVSEGT